jgi:hypothetical protein
LLLSGANSSRLISKVYNPGVCGSQRTLARTLPLVFQGLFGRLMQLQPGFGSNQA